jgi:hypothetical protein
MKMKIILLLVCLMTCMSAQASHRALLFNDIATEKILEIWPDFVETINNEQRGVENMGERSVIIQAALRAHIGNLLKRPHSPSLPRQQQVCMQPSVCSGRE